MTKEVWKSEGGLKKHKAPDYTLSELLEIGIQKWLGTTRMGIVVRIVLIPIFVGLCVLDPPTFTDTER